jgi:site-specific DNA-methyltransferase (adenine-specific)
MQKPQINQIYYSDSLTLMKMWPDNIFDHCITDPPYNMSKKKGLGWAYSNHITMSEDWDQFSRSDYLSFTRSWITEVSRLVKPNGNIFIFGTFHNIYDIGNIILDMNFKIINSIVWFKPNAQPNITCRMLTESTEYIIWLCNGTSKQASKWTFNYDVAKKLNGGKQMRNMWEIPYPSIKERMYGKHPAQKPLSLLSRILLIATNPDELILDCFAGSGTTGVVAKNLNRNYVMIDNKQEYIDIAKIRLEKVKIEPSLKLFV